MPGTFNSEIDPGQPMVYQIRLKGHLGCEWTDRFEGLTLTTLGNGEMLLTSPVNHRAALYSLLKKVRDVGIPLLSVMCVEPGQTNASDVMS